MGALGSLPGFLFYHVLPMIMMNWMTVLVIVIVMVLFAVFRERLLLALAGDRKFHSDMLSTVKVGLGIFCCSCGWKTWCSPCLGCCHCLELPFVRVGCCSNSGASHLSEAVLWFQDSVQKLLGLTPRTLIISKVVAGDLPLEEDRKINIFCFEQKRLSFFPILSLSHESSTVSGSQTLTMSAIPVNHSLTKNIIHNITLLTLHITLLSGKSPGGR